MRLPSWLSIRRTSSTIGTITVTLAADTSAYVAGMKDAASIIRYHRAVEHERNVGRAYVGLQLDELARRVGLDPIEVWRLPRARDERLVRLNDPDRAVRQAAEAAWLQTARTLQAERAAARQAVEE